jgi:hypothetical protein
MLGTTLQKIEEALGEIALAVSKHSTLLLITKTRTFPKITLNPDQNESIHYATDELIRCQRALNSARRHLTNLGIEPEPPIDKPIYEPTTSVTSELLRVGKPITLTPGHGSEEETKKPTQGSQPTIRQPVRTELPRVLGKPIGLPDNLSPHSEG